MKLGGAARGIVMSCDVITGWWTTLVTRGVKLPVGCDLCGLASQFHIYLQDGLRSGIMGTEVAQYGEARLMQHGSG